MLGKCICFLEFLLYSPRTLQEASFWIVDVVINEIMPPDYYSYAMCYASVSVHFHLGSPHHAPSCTWHMGASTAC